MLKHLYNSTQVLVDLSFFLYWQYLLKQFLSNWFLKFHLCTKYAVSALLCHKGTGKSKASILRFSFYCYVRKHCMGYEKNAMNIYLEIQKLWNIVGRTFPLVLKYTNSLGETVLVSINFCFSKKPELAGKNMLIQVPTSEVTIFKVHWYC